MDKCFVCGNVLNGRAPDGEILMRPDGGAHIDCLWHTAKLVVYGE